MTINAQSLDAAYPPSAPGSALRRLLLRMWKARVLYLMLLPMLAFFIVFRYYPYWGLTLAFKQFSPVKDIWEMSWVGFEHFERLFSAPKFTEVFWNTVIISAMKLVIGIPVPIFFALLLNEARNLVFKRFVQTVTLFPHFLSWVVYGGVMVMFLAPGGVIAEAVNGVGLNGNSLLVDTNLFRWILVVTDVTKTYGFNAILYLAAMTAISPDLYDAAKVDGANRWGQMRYVTMPGIAPVIVVVLILNLGAVLDAGFEQVFVMYNPAVYSVADIIDTYTYRTGLVDGRFSIATALGLLKGVIGLVLIVGTNQVVKRLGYNTIW